MSKKTILITGGAGMIGQEIAKQLPWKEWEILLFDDFSNPYTRNSNLTGELLHSKFFYGSPPNIADVLRDYKIDVISHQASLVSVGRSMYEPAIFYQQNVQSTAELIQAIKDNDWHGLFLHASSMAVYSPESFYGLTKKAQEEMVLLASKTYGFKSILLRYFSVFSTTAMPDNPYTGILSVIMNQILTSDKIEMYDDGGQTRDLINVKNVAQQHNALLNFDGDSLVMDVKSGYTHTMSDIVNCVQEEMGTSLPVTFNGKKRAGDIYKCPLSEKPDPPGEYLINQVREYCSWIKANMHLFKDLEPTVKKENANVLKKGLVR